MHVQITSRLRELPHNELRFWFGIGDVDNVRLTNSLQEDNDKKIDVGVKTMKVSFIIFSFVI